MKPDSDSPVKRSRQAVLSAGFALILGVSAQYALTGGYPAVGLLGYTLAVCLFVWRLRPYMEGSLPAFDRLDEIADVPGERSIPGKQPVIIIPESSDDQPPRVTTPPVVKRTPSGKVFILDRTQELIFCFDQQDVLVAQWSIPGLNELDIGEMTASDDTVSLQDSSGARVHVIRLDTDENA